LGVLDVVLRRIGIHSHTFTSLLLGTILSIR
jgi:hypothetical protein